MAPPLLGCVAYAGRMGEIVNLKQAKKRQARERAAAEKANDRREEARRQALLDGARQPPER